MAGDVSERRRREVPSELDDIPRREREVVEDSESQEEVSETREVTTSSEYVDQHMDMVLHEIENRESTEERVSQGMDSALHRLEELNSQPESTEKRLEEALESIEERPVPAEKAFASEGSDDHYQAKLDDFETHEASEVQEQTSRETRYDIDSKEALDKAIQQNQHVKRGFSQETYETCEQYVRVISEDSATSTSEIAEKENLSEQTVENWREGVKPRPIQVIENMEAQRLEHENSVPEEALNHRIDPTQVREITDNHKESEQHTIKELVDVVVDIHNTIEGVQQGGVHYAELYDPQKPLVEDRLRDLAIEIRVDREIIQTELNSRLGLDTRSDHEVRIGVTDNRLYYWHVNTSPDMWVNVLADQKFYMSKEDKLELIDELRAHLHIRGGGQTSEHYLNDLINQMSGLENHANNRISRYSKSPCLDGEVMHLVVDMKRKTIEDLKPVITHMGTKEAARVSNLQFPEIHRFRMRFVAIAESDCHLDDEGRFSYYEKSKERRQIVIDFFQEFGDFRVKFRKDNKIQLDLPRSFAVLADNWGIPRGDKAIHNRGLHKSIVNENLKTKIDYPREMVPEDGCFSNGKFSINRNIVLHPGKRLDFYGSNFGVKSLVTSEMIDFVKKNGEPLDEGMGYKKGERIAMHVSEIKQLIENENENISNIAKSLYYVVNNNPNSLIVDEATYMMKPIGINLEPRPQTVYYYMKSERLSAKWIASTNSVEQAIRWALVSPPNHPKKMKKVVDFVKNHPEDTDRVKHILFNEGLEIHPDWREHGL